MCLMDTLFRINGIAVGPTVRGRSLQWSQAYGVDPVVEFYTLPDSVVEKIVSTGQVYAAEDEKTVRQAGTATWEERVRTIPATGARIEVGGLLFERLSVLSRFNAQEDGHSTVEIADLRWRLRYTHIERSYNMRKPGTERRLVNGELRPVELADNVLDYGYRRDTLSFTGRPWTASEILNDVMRAAVGDGNYRIDGIRLEDSVEDLDLSTDARTALQQVLAFLPGVRVWVDREGLLRASYALDSSDLVSDLQGIRPEEGAWGVVNRRWQRPSKYRVYFDRKVEIRFDAGRGRTRVKGKEPPEIENVIENPFLELDVEGRRATKGEYIEASKLFTAAAARTDKPLSARVPESEFLRFMVGNVAAWSATFLDANNQKMEEQWASFVSNVVRDYRSLYRVRPDWSDRVRLFEPRLTGTLDRETGTRGKAPVYTNYITKLAYYVLPGGNVVNPKQYSQGFETKNWAENLDGKNVSPFEVVMIDPVQGIFRLVPRYPIDGHVDKYVPGLVDSVEGFPLPQMGVVDAQQLWAALKLKSEHKVAVILTTIPASPNGIARLEPVDVTVDDAANRLGIVSEPGDAGVQEIFTDLRPAKFAWTDTYGSDLEDLVREGKITAGRFASWTNADECKDIAQAAAARELALKLDLPVGDVVVPLMDIEPQGSLGRVTHIVSSGRTAGGRINTRLVMEDPAPPNNILGLMSQQVRGKIRRLVTDD